MRIAVFEKSFDPITRQEISFALSQTKQFSRVILVCTEEGILPFQTRLKLLKKACAPYRKLEVREKIIHGTMLEYPEGDEQEKAVRDGDFHQAAYGIRTILNQEGLYYEQIVEAHCSKHRYEHVLAMSALCERLAKIHQVDPGLAKRTGLLHDITKSMPQEEAKAYLEAYYPEGLSQHPNIWHSFTAVYWIKQNLCLYDSKLLHAIFHHTLGGGKSALDQIVYIADKTDPTRGYDASKELAIAEKDLKKGAAFVQATTQAYRKEREGLDV